VEQSIKEIEELEWFKDFKNKNEGK